MFLALSNGSEYDGECKSYWPLVPRPHSVSVSEFGAVGDGITVNTVAFQNAIFYLKSFADKGGAQLYVPPGKWLIGCISLTSHLTLFLEKDAVILGSQVCDRFFPTEECPYRCLDFWRCIQSSMECLLQSDHTIALNYCSSLAFFP